MAEATPQSGRKGSRPHPKLERPLNQRRLSTPGTSRAPSGLFAGYGSRRPDGLAATIASAMLDVPVDFGGGCPILKGFLLADLIVDRRMIWPSRSACTEDGRSYLRRWRSSRWVPGVSSPSIHI